MKAGQRRRLWLGAVPMAALAMLVPASAQAATADLAISKADSPDPVVKGAVLTYTIEVSNLGPGAASGVTVTDKLPNQVDFVSATATQGSCDRKGRKVTCALGELAPGEYAPGATVTIKVRPKKTGQLTNSASVAVGAGDTDPVAANDSATETTTVVAGGGGGPTCAGRAATIVGTGGADTIVGTGKRDVIKARGGNDKVRGLAGKDIVCAGGGNDTVRGGSGNDRLKGGSGRDLLKGGGGGDRLQGGSGRDVLKGGGGRDRLRGGSGRDRCRGGAGDDSKRSC